MGGFARQQRPVDAAIVREVGSDFDFSGSGSGSGSSREPAPPARDLGQLAVAPGPGRPPAARVAPFGPMLDDDAPAPPPVADAESDLPFSAEAPRKKRFLFF
jgi:hypothetical protein